MKIIKKTISFCVAAMLSTGLLLACGQAGEGSSQAGTESENGTADNTEVNEMNTEADTLQVVTTIFPIYDWMREIVGDNNADITLLLDSGVDLHSYQPTAEDMLTISDCDLFVYVGGESDDWVEDALREAVNPDLVAVNLLDEMGSTAKEEELVEGMEADEEDGEAEEADETEDGETDDAEEVEYDEHIWLSLRNAERLCGVLAEKLAYIDSANADSYRGNCQNYTQKLSALDEEYQTMVSAAPVHTLLFGDRFPFRYLVDDYGLGYYAAFVGCSAETEASFETISFLARKTDELGLKHIMTIEGTNHDIAETIIANTESKDQTILTLDSMQATTADDVAAGATYLSAMETNFDVLTEALQ